VAMNMVSVFAELDMGIEATVWADDFEMTFEINDKVRGARKNITLPSLTSWIDLKDRVAQVLNLHTGSLQLQYRFSNEKSNSLPFDLVSLDDYVEMCNQLKPFVVLKILASGKPSKSARKLVTVQLFDKRYGRSNCQWRELERCHGKGE
jgi:hypothetical protein